MRVWLWAGANSRTEKRKRWHATQPSASRCPGSVQETVSGFRTTTPAGEMMFICRFALRLDAVLFLHFLSAFLLFFLCFLWLWTECFIAYRPHFHNSDDFKNCWVTLYFTVSLLHKLLTIVITVNMHNYAQLNLTLQSVHVVASYYSVLAYIITM